VEVDEFDSSAEKEPGRFLWVNRLVSYKRPEVVAEAFRGLPYNLTMVGIGPLEDRLRATLPPNVHLRDWVSRQELISLFERAAGFVHVGEEDFGIAMVEALAAGTPVIALSSGGAKDIVRDGEDGALVGRPEVEEVRRAVCTVAEAQWDPQALAARADTFSKRRFLERLSAHVEPLLA
jgi:glycosyltransferase involved in cell wall biosynthesis